MDISKLLEKENVKYWSNLIKKSSKGVVIMIFLISVLIAVTVDCMLLNTFPAWTIITILVSLTVLIVKIYVNRIEDIATKKQIAKQFEIEYNYLLPILNHLTDEEKEFLQAFILVNRIEFNSEKKVLVQTILAKGLYKYLTVQNYPGIPQPFEMLQVTDDFQCILRKYFEEK